MAWGGNTALNFNQTSKKFGASGLNFNNPHDVKEFAGEVFITDTNNHRVVVTDREGSLLRSFECQDESLKGYFDPWGIAISVDGDVYVTDMRSHTVFMFNKQGNLHQKFGSAELQKPYGIVLAADENILVIDTYRCCVCIFNRMGMLKYRHGHCGRGIAELYTPQLIALNNRQDWIIADYDNRRLIIKDDENNLQRSVALNVGKKNYLVNGVAVDEKDNIYVSVVSSKFPLFRNFCVLMYDSNYTYQGCICDSEIIMPYGMCIIYRNDRPNKSLLVASKNGIHQFTLYI